MVKDCKEVTWELSAWNSGKISVFETVFNPGKLGRNFHCILDYPQNDFPVLQCLGFDPHIFVVLNKESYPFFPSLKRFYM